MRISTTKRYLNLLPRLTDTEFESLKTSIKAAGGLHVPVIVSPDGIVLDGHHRFRACKELGLGLQFHTKQFSDPLEEKRFVIEVNLDRRHLNEFQRAELGCALEEIEGEKARKRMSNAGRLREVANQQDNKDQDPNKEHNLASADATIEAGGKTSHIIAKKIGISPASYERSKKIKQLGTDEQKQCLREGRRSITEVYNQVRKQEIKNRLIQQAQEAAKNNPKYADDSRVRLIHADFSTIDHASIPDSSIDLVFTDPPYGKDWLQFFEPLGKLAFRVLKDGGSLVLYAGHYALPEILDLVGKSGLRYWWEIAIKHNGACRLVHHQHVFVKWKPLLWFVKGDKLRTPDSIVDLIESEPPDKTFHPWQQSQVEAQHIISKLTVEDDVVLDPLMGTGATGIAAVNLRRQFIGIDKDAEVVQKATDRIGSMLSSDKNSMGMGAFESVN